MRYQAISLLIISALIFSGSSFSLEPITTFLTSFVWSIDYADFNPTVENCTFYANETKNAALELLSADIFDNLEELIYAFANNFSEATNYCSNVITQFPPMLQHLQDGVLNLTLMNFTTNILQNSYSVNKYTFYLRYSLYREIYDDAGEFVADLLKIAIFGDVKIPVVRQLNELDEFANMIGASSTLQNHIYYLLQVSQGFIDEGETKAMVPEYTKLLEDTSALLSQLPVLEKAIKAENFNATTELIADIYYKLLNVTKDSAAFNKKLTAFLQKETAVFQDKQKVAKGIQSVVNNLPITLANIQKIATAYQNRDFKQVGQYIRAIFNQIHDGAINN